MVCLVYYQLCRLLHIPEQNSDHKVKPVPRTNLLHPLFTVMLMMAQYKLVEMSCTQIIMQNL